MSDIKKLLSFESKICGVFIAIVGIFLSAFWMFCGTIYMKYLNLCVVPTEHILVHVIFEIRGEENYLMVKKMDEVCNTTYFFLIKAIFAMDMICCLAFIMINFVLIFGIFKRKADFIYVAYITYFMGMIIFPIFELLDFSKIGLVMALFYIEVFHDSSKVLKTLYKKLEDENNNGQTEEEHVVIV